MEELERLDKMWRRKLSATLVIVSLVQLATSIDTAGQSL